RRLGLLPEVGEGHAPQALLVVPEEDPLAEEVHGHHALRAPPGAQRLAGAGEALARGDVEVVLVLEAAEQAAAPAGNLRGVERERLVLGEAQADGGEFPEPGGAAVLAAAPADAAQARRLVADADLAELDAGPEPGGELAHK